MPGPGAAGLRIFHDHLRMVMINLPVENPLGGVDDGFAAREHAVDGVTGVVPKGKADNLAAAIVPPEGVVIKGFVLLRGTRKQVDFPRIEHVADERVAFLPVFSESIWSDGAACHKRSFCSQFLTVLRRAQGRPALLAWTSHAFFNAASTNAAKASVAASSPRRPMTCTPIGPPHSPRSPGTLTHGTPSNVQLRLKAGSPVDVRPSGASSGALGVSNPSIPSNQVSNAAFAASAFAHASM